MPIPHWNNKSSKQLIILSLNVGRGAQAHEIALNEAHMNSVDILLIQEPYIFRERSRRITKKHPSYEAFSSSDDWAIARPRVMSYVRKGIGLNSQQVFPLSSHDLMVLRLSKTDGQSIDIWNIYNAPPGSLGTNILQTLGTLATSIFRNNCLLQGDFNLHHTWWQPSWPRSPSPGA